MTERGGNCSRRRRAIAIVGFVSACGSSSSTATDTASKRIFATRSSYTGALGGLAGADAKCQTAATAANLGGKWKAWLSDSKTNAIDRVTDVGPWALLDGRKVFNNKINMTTVPITPINRDEFGAPFDREDRPFVWTGTKFGGSRSSLTCSDWMSSSGGCGGGAVAANCGDRGGASAGNSWTESDNPADCSSLENRLICIEQ